jgi:hypothetical protein
MSRNRRRWDDDMAVAKRPHEIPELTTQRRQRQNLARRQAIRARQADDKGSNAVNAS